ncbi:Inorganic pyrophosphatase [Cladobotryum mycophilum]|uniref:inorganic diphosphatase n=1 Tax=Cladobotryum mycophilum TaxID=491253 RepID=A0ABR0SCB0_9HYPO
MLSHLVWLNLALAPVYAAAATCDDSFTESKSFDPKSLTIREVGARNTIDWRVWLEQDGDPISPWHDIPLYPDENDKSIVNAYIEIPRWTDGKIETSRKEPLNPIYHDDKSKKPRFVASIWPHKSYPFLYGSLPQTWENSNINHKFTGYPGDNDPMDIFDISAIDSGFVGQVRQVKLLGGLPMIDDNTTDWKVIAINVNDPLAKLVNTVDDLETYRPGMKQTFYDWFIYYKVLRSGSLNIIFKDQFQNATVVQDIVAESHGFWKDLISGKEAPGKISTKQTSQPNMCKSYVKSSDATKKFNIPKKSNILPPEPKPAKYDQWYYLDKDFKALPGQVIDVD